MPHNAGHLVLLGAAAPGRRRGKGQENQAGTEDEGAPDQERSSEVSGLIPQEAWKEKKRQERHKPSLVA